MEEEALHRRGGYIRLIAGVKGGGKLFTYIP